MSQKQLIKTVSRELNRINERIDHKIVKGISYRSDAARHKMLLAQLARAGEHERMRRFGFLSFL